MKTTLLATLFSLIIGATGSLFYAQHSISDHQAHAEEEVHVHANFALFLDGERFNFTREEFMSDKPCSYPLSSNIIPTAHAHGEDNNDGEVALEDAVHLHEMDGDTIHIHAAGVTYGQFFESLGMVFNDTNFIDHEGNEYIPTEEKSFHMYINNEKVENLAEREVQDLDRVLISYGSEESINSELVQIAHTACVFSESCPERGTAPIELCGSGGESKPWILEFLKIQ